MEKCPAAGVFRRARVAPARIQPMLIPRFTLRWLLGLMVAAGLVSLVLAQAVHGQAWAVGVVIGLSSLALVFAAHAWVFVVAWLFAQIRKLLVGQPRATSPFATAGPPPQMVPPTTPD